MSALYGAAGIKHDPELTRALLEAGAEPDDGESRLSRDRGGEPGLRADPARARRPDGGHERARARPRRRAPRARPAVLEHGADPNEGSLVAHAVRRGRGPEMIELLVVHGADVDRPGGETWRGDVPLRTPYQHAVLRGKDELAELLARLGASTDVDPADAGSRRSRAASEPATPLPEHARPRRAGGDRSCRRCAATLDLVARPRRARLQRRRRRLAGRDAAPPRRLDRLGRERRAAARARRRPGGASRPLRHAARLGGHGSQDHGLRTATTSASPSGSSLPARRSSRGSSSSRTARSRSGFRAGASRRRTSRSGSAPRPRAGRAAASPRCPRTPSRARAGSSAAGGSSSAARRRAGTRSRA